MDRLVLDCATLKSTERDTPSVNVHGVISKVYSSKTFKRNTSQGLLVKDDTGQIYVQVPDAPFKDEHIGCDVEINGGVWTSYMKNGQRNWFLDAIKAEVRYQDPKAVERPTPPTKKTTEEFNTELETKIRHYLRVACNILSDEELSGMVAQVKALGWTTEDVRTLAVSLFIEVNRSRGLIK